MNDSLTDYLDRLRNDENTDPQSILDLVPDIVESMFGTYAEPPSLNHRSHVADRIIQALIRIAMEMADEANHAEQVAREQRQVIKDTWDNLTRAGQGVALIGLERQRQQSVEGYNPDHDNRHDSGWLALKAAHYLDEYISVDGVGTSGNFPELIKAGAMIASEIDRLVRLGALSPTGSMDRAKPES